MTLKDILLIANITPENSEEAIAKLLRPDEFSREEMRGIAKVAIGYDPVDYYYAQDVRTIIAKIDTKHVISDELVNEIIDIALPRINKSVDKKTYNIEYDIVNSIIMEKIPECYDPEDSSYDDDDDGILETIDVDEDDDDDDDDDDEED